MVLYCACPIPKDGAERNYLMKNRRNRLTPAQLRERRIREAENKRIFIDEGFSEEDIRFMSKPAQRALMKKYGRG